MPDELVHRVVAPDVLSQREQRPVGVEQSGRVEPAGRVEQLLAFAKRKREPSISPGSTRGPGATGSVRTSTWSIDALPQIPQLDVA